MKRQRWLVLIALVAGLVSCRELVAPNPDSQGEFAVHVLDDLGEPAQDVRVEFTNIGFVSGAEALDWYGHTDDDGMIAPDLPPGNYSAIVSARTSDYDRWFEPVVTLGDAPLVLDPRPWLRPGRVTLPGSVDANDLRLDVTPTLEMPYRHITFRMRINLDEEDLILPWYGDAPHEVDLTGPFSTRVRLHDALTLAPADSVLLSWTPDEFQVRLTLGGNPAPPLSVAVTARTLGASVRFHTIRTTNSIVNFLGHEGIGEIWLDPVGEAPFIPYEASFDFQVGAAPVIELGDYRVEFAFRSFSGEDLYGCTVDLSEATSGASTSRRATEPVKTLYLRPGNYRMTADLEGMQRQTLIADVSSDTTFTFVLDPEHP